VGQALIHHIGIYEQRIACHLVSRIMSSITPCVFLVD